MWNGTHYRPCAQKLGETRITYWNPHLEKECSFDRVKEDWLNTTFTLWRDDVNSTNLHTQQEQMWDFTPALKCSSGLCSSRMLYTYTSSWVTDVLGPLSMEPTDCPKSLVTKHKSMVRKHLRRAETKQKQPFSFAVVKFFIWISWNTSVVYDVENEVRYGYAAFWQCINSAAKNVMCYSMTPLKEKCQTCISVAKLLNNFSVNKDNKRINLYIMESKN